MSYSEVFSLLDKRTIESTKELKELGFWKKDATVLEKSEICKKWLEEVSKIYNVKTPEFKFSQSLSRYQRTGGGQYDPSRNQITLYYKFSLVTLLHEFRHHLQHTKRVRLYRGDVEEDARA